MTAPALPLTHRYCPTCGRRIFVAPDGSLWPHVRRLVEIKRPIYRNCRGEA